MAKLPKSQKNKKSKWDEEYKQAYIKKQKDNYKDSDPEHLREMANYLETEWKGQGDISQSLRKVAEAIETGNDELYAETIDWEIVGFSPIYSYARDIMVKTYVIPKKSKYKQDTSQKAYSHTYEDDINVGNMKKEKENNMEKRELITVVVDCLGSSFLSSSKPGEPDDEVVLLQNIDLNAKPIKILGSGDEITLVLKLDKEKMGMCGLDKIDEVVVQVSPSNATAQNTFLAVGGERNKN